MKLKLRLLFYRCIIFWHVVSFAHAIANNPIIVQDNFEPFNRALFNANDRADRYVLKPLATGYTHIPSTIRLGVSNFSRNVKSFNTLGNDILQLKPIAIMTSIMRIGINSTFGIFGVIDVASNLGLQYKPNTFGNTLRVYGWQKSRYLILPLLGPSTVRDAIGTVSDIFLSPTWLLPGSRGYYVAGANIISTIDIRAQLLPLTEQLKYSVDPYITVRDQYLITRNEVIQNTNNTNIEDLLNDDDTNIESSINTQHI